MRKPLERAEPGEALRDVLARIGPAEIAPYLQAGPGFRLHIDAPGAAPERVDAGTLEFRFAGTGLVARAEIELTERLGVAVQTVTVTNESAGPSPPRHGVQREAKCFSAPLLMMIASGRSTVAYIISSEIPSSSDR